MNAESQVQITGDIAGSWKNILQNLCVIIRACYDNYREVDSKGVCANCSAIKKYD